MLGPLDISVLFKLFLSLYLELLYLEFFSISNKILGPLRLFLSLSQTFSCLRGHLHIDSVNGRVNGRVFKMASQEILINVIKKIHNKRKRADLDSIMIEAKDIELSTDEIVKLLETLCQENTLKLVSCDLKKQLSF